MTDLANQAYYRKPEMIKFLLAENLALKTLLHDKGFITAEEFKVYQQRALVMLEEKVNQQIENWKKDHPQEAAIINNLDRISSHLGDPVVS